MGLLNKIHGLIQAGRCLLSIFCDERFEYSKADPRVFRKFDNGEVVVVIVVHMGDILAHAKDQATMERFAAGLGVKFKVKSVVETFSLEKASKTSVHSGVPTQPQTSEE